MGKDELIDELPRGYQIILHGIEEELMELELDKQTDDDETSG